MKLLYIFIIGILLYISVSMITFKIKNPCVTGMEVFLYIPNFFILDFKFKERVCNTL